MPSMVRTERMRLRRSDPSDSVKASFKFIMVWVFLSGR
jgi:hypothetical protein